MITIRGCSDDNVIIEGDMNEEFGCYSSAERTNYLGCSDGTLLSIRYTREGVWRINLVRSGSASYSKVDGLENSRQYSDIVTLDGAVSWVVLGYSKVMMGCSKVMRGI